MDILRFIYLLLLLVGYGCCHNAVRTRSPALEEDFENLCSLRCPFQNKTEENFDAGCGSECKIVQCSRGCHLWRKALDTSCQAVCNGTQSLLSPKELHCVMGCNEATNLYFQKLKDDIGIPPAPYLVADTLTATSLSLAWEGVRYSDINYLVQWRYEEHAGAWQYCRNQTWGPSSIILVDNLQPYTKYRFRVALLLSPHSEPIVSKPSVVISTIAAGLPSSAPLIVRATAVDSRRISISWRPGPFPNGPIHSYVLQLVGDFIAFKEDIPATQNADFHMFQNLNANSKYVVSVTMRNAIGEGPVATAEIFTPPEPLAKDVPQPILILGSRQRVIKQRADMLNAPQVIYESSYDITGIAIHVKKNLLFLSDTTGYISVASLQNVEKPRHVLGPEDTSFRPLDLSVDWLNQHLYVLGEVSHEEGLRWQVSRCGLDGRGLTVAVAGITVRPLHMEVDPYNGYLFWLIQGQIKGGLYRLDLANISNGIKHDVVPDIILEDSNLGAFVVDHTNFCVLVPNLVRNTVFSVSLDGREVVDLRSNTQQALFRNVTSLALGNGLFYWTNGNEVFAEDYHEGQNTYFHNHYPGLTDRYYVNVAVDLPASQPTPVPVNPPIMVQAVLGGHLAKVTWQTPHLVGGQGKGAWQSWSYELQLKHVESGAIITQRDIVNATFTSVDGLKGNSEYIIKAAAYTSAGIGPWSTEFHGRTLDVPRNGQYPTILWSAAEGLLESDVTGEEVETLIPAENMKDDRGAYIIVDIAWLSDMLYFVTNTSRVYWYDLTEHEYGRIPELDSVGCLSVEWIGRKLYWSNPKQQLIMRGNLFGTQQEPLPFLTIAKELSVDSIDAFIYWSTGHAVECARLNGDFRTVYYPAQLFSGKQVMGLTLNKDDESVYWIIRSSDGSSLYRADMMRDLTEMPARIEPTIVANLQHPNMQGPLCYFSEHLMWLQDNRNAVIGDLEGQNAAMISGIGLSGLNMVAVRDTNVQDLSNFTVIPEPIKMNSIQVIGSSTDFNITWEPVINVECCMVFYEITIRKENNEEHHRTKNNVLVYEKAEEMQPYTSFQVSIKAFTYWGSSPPVRKTLLSPQSLPTRPRNVRTFNVPNDKGDGSSLVVRWDPPEHPNGLLTGYMVRCRFYTEHEQLESSEVCGNINVVPERTEFILTEFARNTTFWFEVQAFTTAGEGDFTNAVSVNTSEIWPIPKLLILTFDAVKLADCDYKDIQILSSDIRPVDVVWSHTENLVYWLNDQREIFRIHLDGSNKSKIHTLKGTGLSLAIDWIGRFLYWSELEDREMASSIYRLDLNQLETENWSAEKIIHRFRRVHELEVLPYSSSLIWVEVNRHGSGHLMRSRTDGTAMGPFFSVHLDAESQQCSCLENPRVGKTFTVDQTDPDNPRIYYSDGQHMIYRTTITGCHCHLLLEAPGLSLPTSLTTDQKHIFWSNETEGTIYMSTRSNDLVRIPQPGVGRVRAVGPHLQPIPSHECLSIESVIDPPEVLLVRARAIVLNLPEPERPTACENITRATAQYTVYYGITSELEFLECSENLIHCNKIVTYHKTLEISPLKPYSSYVIRVFVKNHYSEIFGLPTVAVPVAAVQTSAGAPSRPREVKVIVLNPTLLEVQWQPPKEFNDRAVSYEVHWKTEGFIGGLRSSGEFVVGSLDELDGVYNATKSVQVRKVNPAQLYQVWVRVFSQNSRNYTDSEPVEIETYPLPSNITLAQATPYSLELFWTPPRDIAGAYYLQYYDFGYGDWRNVSSSSEDINFMRYVVQELTPKTSYLFRVIIKYVNSKSPFIWPNDERFNYETLGDRPSRPGMPIVLHLRRGVYQVFWELSRDNGASVELYLLEGLVGRTWRNRRESNFANLTEFSNEADPSDWFPYYNGTDNYWIISELSPSLKYVFRVRARNRYGWSDASERSKSFDYSEAAMVADQQELGIVLGITLPIAIVVCIVVSILVCCLFRRREKEKKELQVLTLATNNRGPDVELATLRELPRRGNFLANANILYTAADPPTDEEIALLPHIRREQFKLTKFLGSGAFGEVYEGLAQGIPGADGQARVAIKALRKGASEQEKSEFLKEAQLMSHFKHRHILQLVGVCLDNDPNYILMELMEGGDLLSYLRVNRPLISTRNCMKLLDLLEICVDVAKGCRYLEDMHFVHRDLACRNCLVSSLDATNRVVKIGDFGLARDIYKNDYYRKEGEGLLPVRWMAPESLVDGVFTTQSDVWSFGVLLWEIMTLGQQPYPARTNIEVLHYVRHGGRLGKPCNCSDQLHHLMLKCWNFNPEDRPTFKYCLDILTELKERTANSPLTHEHSGAYLEVRSGNSWKDDDESTGEPSTPSDTNPGEPPPYLQLLYEEDSSTADGYEVPRTRTFSGASCVSEVLLTSVPLVEHLPPSLPPDLSTIGRLFNTSRRLSDSTSLCPIVLP